MTLEDFENLKSNIINITCFALWCNITFWKISGHRGSLLCYVGPKFRVWCNCLFKAFDFLLGIGSFFLPARSKFIMFSKGKNERVIMQLI